MAKYLLLWEVDTARIPNEAAQRQQQWLQLHSLIAAQLNNNTIKDFGVYIGESKGYCIVEGTGKDIKALTNMYVPSVTFKVSEVLSTEEVTEIVQNMRV